MFVSAMSDATSKHRQKERNSGKQKEFGQILEAEEKRQRENYSMEGKAVGYTRTGQLHICGIMQRTYN